MDLLWLLWIFACGVWLGLVLRRPPDLQGEEHRLALVRIAHQAFAIGMRVGLLLGRRSEPQGEERLRIEERTWHAN